MSLEFFQTSCLKVSEAASLISLVIITTLLFIFGFVAQEIAERSIMTKWDRRIVLALRNPADPSTPIGPAWLREAARDITSLGSVVVLGIITFSVVGYLFLSSEAMAAWLILISVVSGVTLNTVLKIVFARDRPDRKIRAAQVFTKSFPSGHAALSAITYLTMGALLTRINPSFELNLYIVTLALFLTVIIGLSRIYMGVHYPTDIVGGWCIGFAWAFSCWILMGYFQCTPGIA